jgi:hypothetical protein
MNWYTKIADFPIAKPQRYIKNPGQGKYTNVERKKSGIRFYNYIKSLDVKMTLFHGTCQSLYDKILSNGYIISATGTKGHPRMDSGIREERSQGLDQIFYTTSSSYANYYANRSASQLKSLPIILVLQIPLYMLTEVKDVLLGVKGTYNEFHLTNTISNLIDNKNISDLEKIDKIISFINNSAQNDEYTTYLLLNAKYIREVISLPLPEGKYPEEEQHFETWNDIKTVADTNNITILKNLAYKDPEVLEKRKNEKKIKDILLEAKILAIENLTVDITYIADLIGKKEINKLLNYNKEITKAAIIKAFFNIVTNIPTFFIFNKIFNCTKQLPPDIAKEITEKIFPIIKDNIIKTVLKSSYQMEVEKYDLLYENLLSEDERKDLWTKYLLNGNYNYSVAYRINVIPSNDLLLVKDIINQQLRLLSKNDIMLFLLFLLQLLT